MRGVRDEALVGAPPGRYFGPALRCRRHSRSVTTLDLLRLDQPQNIGPDLLDERHAD